MMMDEVFSEDEPVINTQALIAYRLGRVEKAVDSINTASVARDDRILDKMEAIGQLAGEITSNKYRIATLEQKFANINKFLTGVAISLVAVVAQILFDIV